MPEDINFSPELSPLDMVFWWFVNFLFGSTGTMEEAIITFVVMLAMIGLILYIGWKGWVWFRQGHQDIVTSNR